MLARILLKKRLIAENATPVFNFIESDGKLRLNISIEVDPAAFVAVPDSDRTTNPNVRRNFRDVTMGVDVKATVVKNIQLDAVDIADGSSTFTFTGTIESKLPGTGGNITKLKLQEEPEYAENE